jgi:predicted phage tail protein
VGDEFDAYTQWSGIFTTNEASTCGSDKINHAIVLVGWGTDPTYGTYWILRNSWGYWWGDDGYMYIKAGTSNIGVDATYVEYLPLPDRIAPMVKKIDTSSHTSDNKIVQNEQVGVSVNKIYAVFDEAMYYASGVNDITNPANYSLVNLGADNASGGGDDTAVTINSVTYSSSSYTATLNVNDGAALPNASYVLTISGSANVKDKGGNLLDGNGDGIAGGDYTMAFTISVKSPAPLLTAPASKGYTNDQTPQFTWNAANFATSYQFQLDDTSNFSSLLIDQNVGSATSYTSALTLPAGKYYWRVFGINRYAAAGAISSRYFTIDITPPPVPVLKSPADAASYKGTPSYTWGAATGAKYYQFYWSGEGGTSYTSAVLTTTKHKPPTQPLGAYTWQVRAGDLAGNWSDWSSARSLTVIPPIPAAPVLAAPAKGLNTIDRTPDLDWNDVDYAVQYEIQISASSKFSPLLQSGNPASSTFTPGDLADGKYYWRVRAFNVNNEPGKWCSVRYFVVDNIAPLTPVLVAPADGITAKGTPTYSWKAAAGAKYYQFRYLTSPANELIYTSPEQTSTSHKPPTQAPGDYVWQVRARDLAGNWGAWSATRAITIIPTVPAAPKLSSPASGSSTSDTTPDLVWNAVAYGNTYEIQIDDASGFGSPYFTYTGVSSTTYTTGLLDAGKWYWRVRAVNTLGQAGKWSSYRTLTITP